MEYCVNTPITTIFMNLIETNTCVHQWRYIESCDKFLLRSRGCKAWVHTKGEEDSCRSTVLIPADSERIIS
jgi:hypothetical protein